MLIFDLCSTTHLPAQDGVLAEEAVQEALELGLGRLIQLAGLDALRSLPHDRTRNVLQAAEVVAPWLQIVSHISRPFQKAPTNI